MPYTIEFDPQSIEDLKRFRAFMKLKEISIEEFALDAGKFLGKARRAPLIIRSRRGEKLILRPLADDDLLDEVIVSTRSFRASVRKARQNRASGKGVNIRDVRKII